jgi:hypothetical protein
MLKQASILAPLSAAMIGMVGLPAGAQTATVQGGTQAATISGDNNQIIQVINQYNLANPGRGIYKRNSGQGNSATVQNASQGAAVQGNQNQVVQATTQENIQKKPNSKRDRDRKDRDSDDKRDRDRKDRHDDDD